MDHKRPKIDQSLEQDINTQATGWDERMTGGRDMLIKSDVHSRGPKNIKTERLKQTEADRDIRPGL